MRKTQKIILANLLLLSLVGCKSNKKDEIVSNNDFFIISNIQDQFSEQENEKIYKLYAEHDDHYVFKTKNNISLSILDEKNKTLAQENQEISIELNKNQKFYLKVKNNDSSAQNIKINVQYMNQPIKLPYTTNFKEQKINTNYSETNGLLKASSLNYVKREGGTYIYSNNPELFTDLDLNQCIMQNNQLQGDIYMAFEHANYSSKATTYLGYKLINNENHDIYITVENVGFQAGGSWFGQKAWYDFYNTKFQLPEDYFNNGKISDKYSSFDYGYVNYTPRIYTPTTYKLPKGESFFVIGGSSIASYNQINVDNSANKVLGKNQCSNGQVKFKITGGKATGKMFIYDNINKINDDMQEVGYVTIRNGKDYGRQYQGMAKHHGVIDNDLMWEFNDLTKSASLPVKYSNQYATDISKRAPYEVYNNQKHDQFTTTWMTHLNPQNSHKAVGMDMVEFICNTTNGKQVKIDNYHADGSGEAANTANWMIEYQDNLTFVNRGNKSRKIVLKLKDNGTLAILIRDKEGNVLQNFYSVGLAKDYKDFIFEIAPQSSLQLVLDYLLVACSYGNVTHEITLI